MFMPTSWLLEVCSCNGNQCYTYYGYSFIGWAIQETLMCGKGSGSLNYVAVIIACSFYVRL